MSPTALEKLLPGHGPLPPAAVPVGSRSPLLSPGTASGCWEQPVPSWLAGSTCPSHACPGKHRSNAGPRETLGTAILHGAAHGRQAAEWNGIRWRKPRPPCLRWLGTLCCWRSVPLTRRQCELSDALVGVCAGTEPRPHVPKPNPRVVVAAHSCEIILKQTAGHRSCGCPLPGCPQGPQVASLHTPTPLGGPGSSLWLSLVGLLCSQGC